MIKLIVPHLFPVKTELMRVAIRLTCALLRGVGGKKKTREKETLNKRLKYDNLSLEMAAFEEFYALKLGLFCDQILDV